tara:strand:+ start:668 stop:1201 length:534 start_codon:yes stop_codon:yes gene_type:complete
MSDRSPSAWKIEQAMSVWQAARARLVQDDAELAHDEAALSDLLGQEAGEIEDILARVLRGAVHAASMAVTAGDMADNLKAREARYKRRADAMRATAFAIMDALDRAKIELPDITASLRKGQIGVNVFDPDAVPDIYAEIVTTRKIDKATVLSVLKSGQDVPGAALQNGIPSLTLRTR